MKKLAKKLVVGFIAMATMALSMLAVGCDDDLDTLTCEHDYGSTATQVVRESTCMEKGEELWTCGLCGHEKTVATAKKEHYLDDGIVTQESTCTTAGIMTYRCMTTDCTYTKTEKIEKTAHNRVDVAAVQPTCTEGGMTAYAYCADCKTYIVPKTVLSALGHQNKTLPGTAATCTENGLTSGLQCVLCDKIIQEQRVISATGHIEVVVKGYAASCGTGLTDGRKCGNCGEILVAQQIIPAIGVHPATATRAAIPATCTSTGLTAMVYCTSCGQTVSGGEEIPMIAHNIVNGYCTVCDYHEHSWVIQNAVAATCTTDGKTMGKYCSVCGEVNAQQITIPATNHINPETGTYEPYSYGEDIAATCTTNGSTKGLKCIYCGGILQEATVIPATGHTIVDGACVDCGFVHVHTVVEDAAVKATCTTSGLTAGSHCSTCQAVIVAQTVTAPAHSWDEHKICTVCDFEMPASEYLIYAVNDDGGYTITGINESSFRSEQNKLSYGDVNTLIIPSTYNGKDVTRVSRLAFSNSGISIHNIIIRDGNKEITLEYGAFSSNKFVKTVVLERTVYFEAEESVSASGLYSCYQFGNLPSLEKIVLMAKPAYGYVVYYGGETYWRQECSVPDTVAPFANVGTYNDANCVVTIEIDGTEGLPIIYNTLVYDNDDISVSVVRSDGLLDSETEFSIYMSGWSNYITLS